MSQKPRPQSLGTFGEMELCTTAVSEASCAWTVPAHDATSVTPSNMCFQLNCIIVFSPRESFAAAVLAYFLVERFFEASCDTNREKYVGIVSWHYREFSRHSADVMPHPNACRNNRCNRRAGRGKTTATQSQPSSGHLDCHRRE